MHSRVESKIFCLVHFCVAVFLKSYATPETGFLELVDARRVSLSFLPGFTGRNTTISHHTIAWPAIVSEVRTRPVNAKSGTKYVRMNAVGILAVFLGT